MVSTLGFHIPNPVTGSKPTDPSPFKIVVKNKVLCALAFHVGCSFEARNVPKPCKNHCFGGACMPIRTPSRGVHEAGFIHSFVKIMFFYKVPHPFHWISRSWNHTKCCKNRDFYKLPNPFHWNSRSWIHTKCCKNLDF